jgi:hypothetical protein
VTASVAPAVCSRARVSSTPLAEPSVEAELCVITYI